MDGVGAYIGPGLEALLCMYLDRIFCVCFFFLRSYMGSAVVATISHSPADSVDVVGFRYVLSTLILISPVLQHDSIWRR